MLQQLQDDSPVIVITPVPALQVCDGVSTYIVLGGVFYKVRGTVLETISDVDKGLRDRVTAYMRIPVVSRRDFPSSKGNGDEILVDV